MERNIYIFLFLIILVYILQLDFLNFDVNKNITKFVFTFINEILSKSLYILQF